MACAEISAQLLKKHAAHGSMLVVALLLADKSMLALATTDTWTDLTPAALFAQASSDPQQFLALSQEPSLLFLASITHLTTLLLAAHQAHQALQAHLDLTVVLALVVPLVLKAHQALKAQQAQAPQSSAQLLPFPLPCLLY